MPRTLALLICLAAAAVGVSPWVGAALPAASESPVTEDKPSSKVARPTTDKQQQRNKQETKRKKQQRRKQAKRAKRSYLTEWLHRAAQFTPPAEPRPLPPLPEPPQQLPAPPVPAAPPEPPFLELPSGPEMEPASPSDSVPRSADPQPVVSGTREPVPTKKRSGAPQPLPFINAPELPAAPEATAPEASAREAAAEPDQREATRQAAPLFVPPAQSEPAAVSKPPVFSPPDAPKAPQPEAPRSQPMKSEPAAQQEITFPPLPPDPYANQQPALPPLCVELDHHGGSYLYVPEGDGFHEQTAHQTCDGANHEAPKRLPEWFQAPQPCTQFSEYLGADPIQLSPGAWPGLGGYQWEPRFVAHGRYDVFGLAFQENDARQDGLGHNLTLDADLRLTGTERFHLQHRPVGEDGSGGSFYQFNDVDAYQDNSTAEPARIWFEGELASIFSGFINNPTKAWDLNFALGKFPLALHNSLLMNDEVAGLMVGNNNLRLGPTSNLNARVFWLFDDVNSFSEFGSDVLGADAFVDLRHAFIEATYAYRQHGATSEGDAHYLALSATQFFGPSTLSARAMTKIAGPADSDGQLFVLEGNTHIRFDHGVLPRTGIHHGVAFATAFYATNGWSPIAGGNFNRIRSSFEVNPLVLIARGDQDDTPGVAVGIQLFGENEDSSLTPEIAWEAPSGQSVLGAGLKYQRQTSVQSFLELRGLVNFSSHDPFDRDGVFASHHWLF